MSSFIRPDAQELSRAPPVAGFPGAVGRQALLSDYNRRDGATTLRSGLFTGTLFIYTHKERPTMTNRRPSTTCRLCFLCTPICALSMALLILVVASIYCLQFSLFFLLSGCVIYLKSIFIHGNEVTCLAFISTSLINHS